MAIFEDRNGQEWKVELDAPLIEEVREKHSVDLVNLEKDPLLKLRNDPMVLVPILYLLCQDQIAERQMSPQAFGKAMPHCDVTLPAVQEAVVGFFPSGRHSHIREALTKYEEMNAKTDQLLIEKMTQAINDEPTMKRLGSYADSEMQRALDEMFPLSPKADSSITAEFT